VLAYYLLVGENDSGLADEFNGDNPDAHTRNAKVWGVSRQVAKTLIFLLVYGGQPKLMVERKLFPTLKQAEAAFKGVKENQPAIDALMRKVIAKATRQGYVRSISGRQMQYPMLQSKDKWKRMRAERQCFNALIQGSSRDIINLLVVQSLPMIQAAGANLVNIVHDECLVEVAQEKATQLQLQLNGVWERRTDILPGVTINGSWNIGSTWYEAK
jgi:DNA polymerase I-like protein with 3'-5' exonuclease and polymerase domains